MISTCFDTKRTTAFVLRDFVFVSARVLYLCVLCVQCECIFFLSGCRTVIVFCAPFINANY